MISSNNWNILPSSSTCAYMFSAITFAAYLLRKESRFNRMKRPGSTNVRAQANRRLLPQPLDQRMHQLSARPRYLLSNLEVCSHSFDLIQCIRTCLIDSFLYSYIQEESIWSAADWGFAVWTKLDWFQH
jgi:hypothetical protein